MGPPTQDEAVVQGMGGMAFRTRAADEADRWQTDVKQYERKPRSVTRAPCKAAP